MLKKKRMHQLSPETLKQQEAVTDGHADNSPSNSGRKVFCIGFNKTGTTSLHHFFKSIGLNSTHNTWWPRHSRARNIDKSLFGNQCYSDGEQADFVALDAAFPGSLFVLNNRDERDWLYSRLKHVMRHNEAVNIPGILMDDRYGWMARDFFFDEALAIRKWICERRIYIMQARQYFEGRSDFIEIDVTTSKQWDNDLLRFLESNSFSFEHPAPNEKSGFHSNKRKEDRICDQSLLAEYKTLADDIRSEINGS